MHDRIPSEIAARALELASAGKPIRDILTDIGYSRSVFYRFVRGDASFRQAFSRARADGYEALAESVLTMVDDDCFATDPQLLKLKADNYKWFLACVEPDKYGQRQNIRVETVSIGDALTEARARALKVVNPQPELPAPNPFE